MEINPYLRPLFRWWRLIVSVTVLAVVASTVSTYLQPAVYTSKTTLVIGSAATNPNPDYNQVFLAPTLAIFYADMAQREPIRQAVMDALGIDWLPQYSADVVPTTQLLEIRVIDTNPERAQIIANELARQLIRLAPGDGNTDIELGGRQEFIEQQLSGIQIQIRESEKIIEELQSSRTDLNSASQIAIIERDIENETSKLNSLRQSYADFLASSQQRALNSLSIAEPADLPTDPTGTNRLIIITLAGLVGLVLGVGAAYLLEYLDRTIKTTSDVERVFNLPVIGYVSEIDEDENRAVYVAKNPGSIFAENFRLLRSNIEFFQVSNAIKTILITSPIQGNGKTTVATNLALSIAQDEQSVVLVDADLRRPAVHQALGVDKGSGLAEVIRNKDDINSVVHHWDTGNLPVITSGNVPSDVTQVVSSKRIGAILEQLKEKYEVVIIDAPPLIISDSYSLASKVDGVILVLEMGQTTEEQAKTIKGQLDRANARLLGIVFNKISADSPHGHFDSQYRALASSEYYGDYVGHTTKEPNTGSRSKKIMAFFERGEMPPEIEESVQSAITAIRTQPRNMVSRIKKSRENGRSSKLGKTKKSE